MLYTRFSHWLKAGLVLLLGAVSTQAIAHAQTERHYNSAKPVYYCQQGRCYRAETKYKKPHNHNYRQHQQQHDQYQQHQQYLYQHQQYQHQQKRAQQHRRNQHQHQHRNCTHQRHSNQHRASPKLYTGVKIRQQRFVPALRLNDKHRRGQRKTRSSRGHWHGQRQCYSRHWATLVVKL